MIKKVSELWPCLQKDGLAVFTATADQRFLLGEQTFLNTHYPLAFRRFRSGKIADEVSERDILNRLSENANTTTGNRVFIIYGAAGSGKSEFIRWLQLMVDQTDKQRAKATIRIPRTELDVLTISERFQHLLSKKYFSDATHMRWEDARRKPRTLAKLLLLTALERTLESDELINSLYYRLLEWIQPRIASILNALDSNSQMPVEVLTREDLEQLKSETSLSVPLDYEQFRYHLLVAFREILLEGTHLPTTLKLISNEMTSNGYRPLLLIDDLVQSINLFATDLLDYFITLENGNWDVVIGLTPDALTESKRGSELLNRITYLDTVDDRVEKLWLSDMQGNDSYFLSKNNCINFAAIYLDTFRSQNGWQCESCSNLSICKGLGTSTNGSQTLLAPFNDILLQRLFQALPENKGKARQFLFRLKDVLGGAIQTQELIPILSQYVHPEMMVDAEDPFVSRIAEYYCSIPESGSTELSSAVQIALGLSGDNLLLPAKSLRENKLANQSEFTVAQNNLDPSRAAIKSWLDGKEVNRQSLLPLRRGIARWLRMSNFSLGLSESGIASPNDILRLRKVYLGVTPPIVFEGIDDETGINISKGIGLDAFLFHEFATAQGGTKNQLLFNLAGSEYATMLLFDAQVYKKQIAETLESQIHISLEKLAFILYMWCLINNQEEPSKLLPGLNYQVISEWRKQKPIWSRYTKKEKIVWGEMLFEDFYKLRDNIFRGTTISQYMGETSLDHLLSNILMINTRSIDQAYYLGDRPLSEILNSIQESIYQWEKPQSGDDTPYITQRALLETLNKVGRKGVLLSKYPLEVWEQLRIEKPEIFSSLRVSATYKTMRDQ